MTALDRLDAWAEAQMAEYRIPGMVVGVYRHGKLEAFGAYGLADLEHHAPMRRDSVCEICSITKQFTASAVLLLQEAGSLSLADPVGKFVPQMPSVWQSLTLSDLLHHTSGINDDAFDLAETELTAEVLARAASTADRGPGEAWEYSNLAYRLLGDVVACAAGKPFFSYLAEHVFGPLSMSHTHPNSSAIIPNRVRGYQVEGDAVVNAASLSDRVGGGAGGLVSTIDDLSRWSEALVSGKVLGPASRSAMLEPGRLADGSVARPPFSLGGYGLGVNVETVGGRRIEKHAGGWDGASAQLARVHGEGVTIAILTNSGNWTLRPWAGEAVAEFFVPGFRFPAFAPREDDAPARTAHIQRFLADLAAGETLGVPVTPRLFSQFATDASPWRSIGTSLTPSSLRYVETCPQAGRELRFYRVGAQKPSLLVAGFDAQGRVDSFAVSAIPR